MITVLNIRVKFAQPFSTRSSAFIMWTMCMELLAKGSDQNAQDEKNQEVENTADFNGYWITHNLWNYCSNGQNWTNRRGQRCNSCPLIRPSWTLPYLHQEESYLLKQIYIGCALICCRTPCFHIRTRQVPKKGRVQIWIINKYWKR